MNKRMLTYKLIGISLAIALILTSCSAVATPPAATATRMPSPSPRASPTETATAAPVATDTATPVPTATPAPTAELTPMVNPGMDAYCRRGPGTDYFEITYLQAGTNYTVVGQDGLGKWWLIQLTPTITCWMGDPTTVTQGPVEQAPVIVAPPLPSSAFSFGFTSHCDTTLNTMTVSLTWAATQGATAYNIYRNGTLVTKVGQKAISYTDNAPLQVDLKYQLVPINDYGVGPSQTVKVSGCY